MRYILNFSDWFFKQKYLVWFIIVGLYYLITLLNGYPILYSDTSTYLSSGFELEAPADRPITYGILLRLFSLNGLSLMFVPLLHTLILLYVLQQLLSLFFDKDVIQKNLFIISLSILLLSGFGWSINLLLPDIFTAIGFMSLYCVLMNGNTIKRDSWLLAILFISTASHISNVFVFFMITVLAMILRKPLFGMIHSKLFWKKIALIFSMLVVSYVIMGSAISKSKHVFMMGNMAQKGILQEILKDSCETSNLKICNYKDSIPHSFEFFVWGETSIPTLMGGWKATKKEYNRIIRISFTKAKYVKMHVYSSLNNFLSQLLAFGIGEGTGSFGSETPLIKRIKEYTVLDDELCLTSKQHQSKFISMDKINLFYKTNLLFAVVLFVFLVVLNRKQFNTQIKVFILFAVLVIVANAALVAFGSEVSNRYGCKISWLIILIDLLLISKYSKTVKEN